MAKLIGTSGHVDHGKTSLIRALTGIDADRLPEEKSRGMTIDLGFAYLDFPDLGRVSIVDVPGHERFVANMLVGALGIDVALLCIAADAGIMPQTREHFAILDLLPVEQLVVALTRSDLVELEFLSLVQDEIREFLGHSRFASAPICAVSSVTGEGIGELKLTLAAALQRATTLKTGPWYLPIDRAFTVKGHGTVVTGTLMQGSLAEGESAVLMPGGTKTRIRSVQSHELSTSTQEFGTRTALNLAGMDIESVSRGMAVGSDGALFATDCFDAEMRWWPEGTPPKHATRVRVSVGTDEVIGKIFLNDESPHLAQLRLERSTAVATDQPLIVRRYSPPDLIGGGRVRVPQAKPRRRSDRADLAEGSSEGDKILSALVGKVNGVTTDELCRLLGRTPQQLGDTFETLLADHAVLGFAGLWFAPAEFDEGVGRLHASLLKLHADSPTKAWVPRDRAITVANLRWGGKPLDRILNALQAGNLLKLNGTEIAHPDFVVTLNARQNELVTRVEAAIEKAGFAVPSPRELMQLLSVPQQAVDQILIVGEQAGRLVRVEADIYYTPSQIEAMRQVVRGFGRAFTAAEFRDAIGASRKYTIPLLELWDAQRFTKRQGDTRIVIE